jgi:uncharacterized membrane protein
VSAESAHTATHRALERVLAFSDGVFAIAITLLVLDIHLPGEFEREASDAALRAKLAELLPSMVGYVVSFFVIGEFWRAHLGKFRRIVAYDDTLLMLNLLLLLIVGFLPFPTAVVARHTNTVSAMLYGGSMAAAGLVSAAMWAYAVRRGLTDVRETREMMRGLIGRLLAPALFLVSIAVAFVNPQTTERMWWLAIPAAWLARRLEPRPPVEP